MRQEPAELVAKLEKAAELPTGSDERFSGYAVMGMPFASGHILAMRRFPATSIGPGYTSVWHRNPDGQWIFYQDQPGSQACSRYFGSVLTAATQRDIRLEWTGAKSLSVTIESDPGLSWDITLAPTVTTRLLNGAGRMLSESWWRRPRVLYAMGRTASAVLRAGEFQLAGRVPNGQRFVANPMQIWMIPTSRATIAGRDLGVGGWTGDQARLGDFWIPTRGIFAIGRAFFEPFNEARHLSVTAQPDGPFA